MKYAFSQKNISILNNRFKNLSFSPTPYPVISLKHSLKVKFKYSDLIFVNIHNNSFENINTYDLINGKIANIFLINNTF